MLGKHVIIFMRKFDSAELDYHIFCDQRKTKVSNEKIIFYPVILYVSVISPLSYGVSDLLTHKQSTQVKSRAVWVLMKYSELFLYFYSKQIISYPIQKMFSTEDALVFFGNTSLKFNDLHYQHVAYIKTNVKFNLIQWIYVKYRISNMWPSWSSGPCLNRKYPFH